MKFVLAGSAIILLVILFLAFTPKKQLTERAIMPTPVLDQTQQTAPTATAAASPAPTPSAATQQKQFTKPTIVIDAKKSYTAVLHTSVGDITIQLTAKETPITVNNFVFLAKQSFYNSTIFHRVIKGFMIQGGDPTGTGSGGPGYHFDDEAFTGEYIRGTFAMANAGPNTNGSQFFIMHGDVALPKNYVIFGKVTTGMDIVDKIAEAPVEQSGSGEASKPISPVSIQTVTITEK